MEAKASGTVVLSVSKPPPSNRTLFVSVRYDVNYFPGIHRDQERKEENS
jgi:hypothetical protein